VDAPPSVAGVPAVASVVAAVALGMDCQLKALKEQVSLCERTKAC